jgi:hypothetical protein
MRLDPELIPEPLWAISAARLLGRKSKTWRQIRSSALESADDTCSACREVSRGGKGMVCDELWSYDEEQKFGSPAGSVGGFTGRGGWAVGRQVRACRAR